MLHPSYNPQSKVIDDATIAMKRIEPGSVLLSAGFGMCGVPDTLLEALSRLPTVKDLTVVSNNAGANGKGLGRLLETEQITCMVSSFIGWDKIFANAFLQGQMAVDLLPQGSMIERVRAGAFGIPAFYTAVGRDTAVEKGTLVRRYRRCTDDDQVPEPIEYSKPREVKFFHGKKFVMEEAIQGDVAFIHAFKADKAGNCTFRRTASNFSAIFGMNAKLTIVEAETIVEVGEIDPDDVDLASIHVDCVVQAKNDKIVEKMTTSKSMAVQQTNRTLSKREVIAMRAAKEIADGQVVNLGVGIPTLIPDYLPSGLKPLFQSENGVLGVGPYPSDESEVDADLVNAGKECITLLPGGACFDSCTSFGMIRGGHINTSFLGALEVSGHGDLANYAVPGSLIRGMGGAMDLVSCPEKTRVIALTEHVNKFGKSKIVETCSLPLTGSRCISRIITDLAVFDVDASKPVPLTLVELMPGVSLEEVTEKTDSSFCFAHNVYPMHAHRKDKVEVKFARRPFNELHQIHASMSIAA